MAAGRLLIPSWMPALDSDGAPIPNARVYFYADTTTTLAAVFADEALTTPLTNPVDANSSGRFPAIWASDATVYTWSVDAPYGPAGVPFTGTGLQVSQDSAILVLAGTEAAADEALISSGLAVDAYNDILALAAAAPDTDPIVIAGKANVTGSNILGANQAAFLAQIGGVSQTALALGSGSTLVGYQDAGTGSIPTTVSAFIKSQAINVVTQFGVATTNTQAQNVTAFNNAIAAANTQKRMLYVPDSGGSAYQINATLNRITDGLGIIGDGPDKSVIHLYSLGSGVVIKGYYKTSRDYIVINKSAAGTGTTGKGCVHLINWAYGICERTYTAHDLNSYAGILLEQEYDGSASDAAFLTHLGCWYNRFNGIDCLYTTQAAASRGYGLYFTVNANAVGVINPPGEAPGTYTGSCNYNTIDMPNIEQRIEGARLERATNNIFRGGQFLGSQTQVRGINSPGNWFEFTRHNQWLTEPFNMDSNSTGTVILYPSLFNITAQPWSLGTLNRSDIAVRSDQKGTFTPNIKFGTSTAGITYSRQGGTYSKQDNVVTCTFDIRLSSKGVQTGGLSIEGLPFSSVNSSADGIAVCTLYFYSGFTGTGKIGTGYTGGGTVITEIVDHAIAITNVQLTDTAIIFGNITYITPTK